MSLITAINPLGGLVGSFIAKYLVTCILIQLIDSTRKVENNNHCRHYNYCRVNYCNSIVLTLKSVYESLITILVGKFIVGVGGSGIATVVIPKFSKYVN